MYGLGAAAGSGDDRGRTRTPPQREPASSSQCRNKRPRGLGARLVDYIKRTLNPPLQEEYTDLPTGPVRHRPESLRELARATHFSPHEIKLIYRGFKQECPSGAVDEDSFKHIFSQFFPLGDASQYAHFVFNTMKHKQGGKVDFEEFLCTLSLVARGTVSEKLSWVFTLYDTDGDGRISQSELAAVVAAVYDLLGGAHREAAEEHAQKLFAQMDADADGAVSKEELARWCRRRHAQLSALDTVL